MRAISLNLKERALTERSSDLQDPAVVADKEHSNQFLSALFGADGRAAREGYPWIAGESK